MVKAIKFLFLAVLAATAAPSGPPMDAMVAWSYIGPVPDYFTVIVLDGKKTNRVDVCGQYHGTSIPGFNPGKHYTFTVSATLQGIEGGHSEPVTVLVPFLSPKDTANGL